MREICNIPITRDLGKYLGVLLIHNKITRNTYNHIIDRVNQRLVGWKSHCLSIAGRATLIQAVTAALPVYTMQTAWIPTSTCEALDSINRRFLWSNSSGEKGIHLVNWEEVSKTKLEGGLGIRKARENNVAMLAKNGWKVIGGDQGIWADVWRDKYLRNKDVFDSPTANASSTWKGVVKSLREVKKGFKWKIGDGRSVSLWFDVWAGNTSLSELIDEDIMEDEIPLKVSDIIGQEGKWDLGKIKTKLNKAVRLAIFGVPIPRISVGEDKLIWGESSDGILSAKAAYSHVQRARGSDSVRENWKWLWQSKIPQKYKVFLWLSMKEKILTNENRFKRHMCEDNICARCGVATETAAHALRDCFKAKMV